LEIDTMFLVPSPICPWSFFLTNFLAIPFLFFLSLGLSCLTLSPFEGPACSSYPNL
jgi:hypothetical protein